MIRNLIIGLLVGNSVCFLFCRCIWWYADILEARLVPTSDKKSDTVEYYIAGCFNQPNTAFEFLKPLMSETGVYVQFSQLGFDVKATARAIKYDAIARGAKHVRVYAISLGDKVARHLERELKDVVEIYTINPCPEPSVLQTKWKILLPIGIVGLEIACTALGWLSAIPLLPTESGRYSLRLLTDQFITIGLYHAPSTYAHTKGLLLSSLDEFLNNGKLAVHFPYAYTLSVHAKHAQTTANPDSYLQAISELLKLAKS